MIFMMRIKTKKIFQFLCLFFLLELLSFRLVVGQYSLESANTNRTIRCLEMERIALLKFKADLVDEYNRLSSWGIEENKRDCCLWKGVHCHNKNNHVTHLDLRGPLNDDDNYGNGAPLQGRINPSLLELQHFNYLDLSLNDFNHSRIPKFIGLLSKLRYLNLSSANFGGPIPHQLGNLSNLIYLDLSFNDIENRDSELDLVSQLPSLEYLNLNQANLSLATNWLQILSKLTSIKEVHLRDCNLQGDIHPNSFVPSINSSTHLAILDLSWNNISLSLSKLLSFSNSSSTITSIDLSGSNIEGSINDSFETMVFLQHLDLSDNRIEGGISKSLGNSTNLIYLNMGGNILTGPFLSLVTNLSGSFPNILKFPYLKQLDLSRNQLTGYIPEICLQLPNLEYFDMSGNKFTGPVPDLSMCSSKLAAVFLGSNHLEGIITESSLFELSQLTGLDLSFNTKLKVKCNPHWIPPFQLEFLRLAQCEVGPQFPKWIRNQKQLSHLDISDAKISDTIPSWFGTLASQLVYLNASNNQMFGFFPNLFVSNPQGPTSSSHASVLDISRNRVSGSMKFLCHGPRDWNFINLSDNQLSEQLHDCFENFQSLKYLNLANNNFSGTIPNSLGSLQDLLWLFLQNNSFSGVIPTFMRNCTKLSMVDLSENRLTGEIPSWIGDSFPDMVYLRLISNKLFGSIPSNICRLKNIRILDLSSNNISGTIPKCIYHFTFMTEKHNNEYSNPFQDGLLFTSLGVYYGYFKSSEDGSFTWKGIVVNYQTNSRFITLIDLSNNALVGEIPKEIVKLVALISLNLSSNNLTGAIPENIGEMKSLDSLDLSRNHLSAGIPNSLSELDRLGKFNLSYNNLSGKIPQMSHMLTFDGLTYLGNPYLCGPPLKTPCPEDGKTHQDRNFNGDSISDHEEDDKFITQGFYLSLGVGFFVGFWGVFGPIIFNKKTRVAFFKALDGCFDCVYVRIEISKNRVRRYFQKE